METIGFVSSQMPEESRIAIVPKDLKNKTSGMIYIQEQYGKHLGIRQTIQGSRGKCGY